MTTNDVRPGPASMPTEAELAARDRIIKDQIARDKAHALSALNAVDMAVMHVTVLVSQLLSSEFVDNDDYTTLISVDLSLEAIVSRIEHVRSVLTDE